MPQEIAHELDLHIKKFFLPEVEGDASTAVAAAIIRNAENFKEAFGNRPHPLERVHAKIKE